MGTGVWVDFGIIVLYLFDNLFLNLVVSLSFCLLYVTMSVSYDVPYSSNFVAFSIIIIIFFTVSAVPEENCECLY